MLALLGSHERLADHLQGLIANSGITLLQAVRIESISSFKLNIHSMRSGFRLQIQPHGMDGKSVPRLAMRQ